MVGVSPLPLSRKFGNLHFEVFEMTSKSHFQLNLFVTHQWYNFMSRLPCTFYIIISVEKLLSIFVSVSKIPLLLYWTNNLLMSQCFLFFELESSFICQIKCIFFHGLHMLSKISFATSDMLMSVTKVHIACVSPDTDLINDWENVCFFRNISESTIFRETQPKEGWFASLK